MSQPDSERKQPDDERVVALHRATLTAVDFRRARFDTFSLGGCLFDRCDFRGLKLDHRLAPLFVAVPRSVFRDCYFDGADMRRARLAQSRFERCTFDDARLDGFYAAAAEFIDCRFAGPLDDVTFHGTPSGSDAERLDPPRRRNEFRGNDFRDAELIDVAFVAGVDMDRQRFPDDELHVRVDYFHRRLAKATREIKQWYERERAPAQVMLSRCSRRGGATRTSSSRAGGRRASRRRTACRLGCGSCSSTSDRATRVTSAFGSGFLERPCRSISRIRAMRSRGSTSRVPR